MKKIKKSFAFIDSQNLNLSIRDQGWILDFRRFRKYLEDKYGVVRAFLFIGYVPQNQSLYTKLMVGGRRIYSRFQADTYSTGRKG
jgi:hypothetical protein